MIQTGATGRGPGRGWAVLVRGAAVCVGVALASGCMPARNITLTDVPPPARSFVTDATQPDTYPNFATGEGYIYSCRYGIAMQKAEEFIPPKARMFEALLAAAWPEAESHQVVLHRFDVYDNQRLKLLSAAGNFMGGGIGMAVASSARRASGNRVFMDRLVVHVDPDPEYVPDDENPIGCNGRGEGEYFASEISAGHSVLVTWLRFDVDGTPYHLRTFYPHQEQMGEGLEHSKREAVRLSIAAAADLVRNGADGRGPEAGM